MNWILIAEIVYIIIVLLVCVRVVYDTQNTTKTLAYLLAVIFLPIVGIIIYFTVGINYRKRKMYSKKIFNNPELEMTMRERILKTSQIIFKTRKESVKNFEKLATLILNKGSSPIFQGNDVTLLLNGEHKFPRVFEALKNAKNHIHIEYYIFEDDDISCRIIDLLIEKAKEGVAVRFIYDDFGSRPIRKKQVPRMQAAGIRVFPFYKIKLFGFANRINYRNHRKIIVVDGVVGFVGGINVSDKYVNNSKDKNKLYWRDTHLQIEGPIVKSLQYIFMGDWNYCAGEALKPTKVFFPDDSTIPSKTDKVVQIAYSGPDSDSPLIQQSLLQAISLAKEEILITTPYFIPGDTILESLVIAAASGTKVNLLVPGISDSKFVNYAARSYYGRLINAGANIYRYQKGFVHAKTMVVDKQLSIVGTANMDIRSFDLNFEVNAIVYDKEIAEELHTAFYNDLKDAIVIDAKKWKERSNLTQILEKLAGLFSPLM